MKKFIRVIAAMMCALLLVSCSAGQKEGQEENEQGTPAQWTPVTVTDDLGRNVTFESEPKKAAVLMASFAETWILAGGELAAAPKDAWEDFDLDLSDSVIDLGSYMKISLETLFDLDADLIIASANTKSQMEMKDTLESAGVDVLYFGVNNFEDYLRMLKTCTDLTGRQDLYEINGTAVLEQVEAAKAAAQKALGSREAPRVLFIRTAASGIHVKGSDGTVLGEMLRDLGCINVADGSNLLENLSLEMIIEEDPEMIFIVMQGSDQEGAKKTLEDTLMSNPAWYGLNAVTTDNVYYLDKTLYHLKPNNRWGTAYEELEKLIYG